MAGQLVVSESVPVPLQVAPPAVSAAPDNRLAVLSAERTEVDSTAVVFRILSSDGTVSEELNLYEVPGDSHVSDMRLGSSDEHYYLAWIEHRGSASQIRAYVLETPAWTATPIPPPQPPIEISHIEAFDWRVSEGGLIWAFASEQEGTSV
ncbi:MAG: hypothetical protein KC561_14115, partial [Myxococcales bacterium]|nr:hypothetical protein [Myxococcales bacterium]